MLEIKELLVNEIIPYENNPRINAKAIEVVANSIREFGFKNPIVVDKDKVVIVGHTRLEASKVLGFEKVPVIIAEDLTEEQVKAFRIMDNKSGEVAEWDYIKLLEEIEDLQILEYDVELTGYTENEIAEIMEQFVGEEEEAENEEDKPEVEFTPELLEEHQHIVLTFDNTLDWQVAQEIFNITPKKALDSREGYERKGVGRVVPGAKYLRMLQEAKNVK